MIVGVVSGKGGPGKSTTAIMVATEWMRRGRSVLIAELDTQASCSRFASAALDNEHQAPHVAVYTGAWRPALGRVADSYDIVVIDTPGVKDSKVAEDVLAVSTIVIVPCKPTELDYWAAVDTLALCRRAQVTGNPDLIVRTLLSQVPPVRTRLVGKIEEKLRGTDFPMFHTQLRTRTIYAESAGVGVGPTVSSPTSKAAAEIMALVNEIEVATEVETGPTVADTDTDPHLELAR